MTKISSHHIGGRGGDRGFPVLKSFEKDIINVLYDADKDCIEDIIEKTKNNGSELHVLPYCVGGVNGKASFNLNYDPYTSSLLPFNPDYSDYYCFSSSSDYILGETFRPVKSFDMDIATLDTILKTNNIQKPDFLSIDTQGSEYDILLGAEGLLENNILGIQMEVEFKPIYKDQKLFGDINELLTARGFEFIKFGGITELSPYRAPIGLRGEGHFVATDALFLKKGSAIGRKTFDDFVKLTKLAFFSIAFQQLETGLKYLSMAQGMANSKEMREDLLRHPYAKFLFELEQKAGQIKKEYLPSFPERYTVLESQSRFIVDKNHKEEGIKTPREKVVAMIKKNELLYKRLLNFRRNVRNALKANVLLGQTIANDLRLNLARNSPIEQLLYDHEFDKLSRMVKSKRLMQYGLRK